VSDQELVGVVALALGAVVIGAIAWHNQLPPEPKDDPPEHHPTSMQDDGRYHQWSSGTCVLPARDGNSPHVAASLAAGFVALELALLAFANRAVANVAWEDRGAVKQVVAI